MTGAPVTVIHKIIIEFVKGTPSVSMGVDDEGLKRLTACVGLAACQVFDKGWSLFSPPLCTINGKLITRIVESGVEMYQQ